jgi:hypothetical protein
MKRGGRFFRVLFRLRVSFGSAHLTSRLCNSIPALSSQRVTFTLPAQTIALHIEPSGKSQLRSKIRVPVLNISFFVMLGAGFNEVGFAVRLPGRAFWNSVTIFGLNFICE